MEDFAIDSGVFDRTFTAHGPRCPSGPVWPISAPCHLVSVSSDPEGR